MPKTETDDKSNKVLLTTSRVPTQAVINSPDTDRAVADIEQHDGDELLAALDDQVNMSDPENTTSGAPHAASKTMAIVFVLLCLLLVVGTVCAVVPTFRNRVEHTWTRLSNK